MKKPRVLISILNWNGGTETLKCIENINRSIYSNYHILVIDNASTDSSLEGIVHSYPTIYILRNHKNLGFAGGQNLGMDFAYKMGYELVWILNNDTKPDERTLGTLVNEIDTDCRIGMVSPVIIDDDENGRIQFCGCSIDYLGVRFDNFDSIEKALKCQNTRPLDICLWGTAILTRSSLMAQIGGFDTKFFAYYEDLDLSVRVVHAGFINRIVPSAVIRHSGINNPDKRPPHYVYFNTRNRFIFWMKHTSRINKFNFIREYLAGALIYASTWREKCDFEKERATIVAVWDGITSHGGGWDRSRKAPFFIFSILMTYPYFFARVLRGSCFNRKSRDASEK